MPNIRIFGGRRVLLPGRDEPIPASIHVDLTTGKIIAINEGRYERSDLNPDREDHWIDAGENIIIPGLVE